MDGQQIILGRISHYSFVFAKTIYLKPNDQFIMGSIVMFWVQARRTDDTVIHDFWIRH